MESTERIGNYDVYRRPGSTRWNPTSEQLRMLRELYYTSGIRSPTVDQIQLISWKLSRYGKIEGKNVFYWFQNHKARQRLKKRLSAMNVVEFPTFHTKPFYEEKTVGEKSSFKEAACSVDQMYAVKHQNAVKALEENQLQLQEDMMNQNVKTLELFPTHCEDRCVQPSENKSCCWRSCEIKEHDNNPPINLDDKERDIVLDLCLSLGNKSCGLHGNWLNICE